MGNVAEGEGAAGAVAMSIIAVFDIAVCVLVLERLTVRVCCECFCSFECYYPRCCPQKCCAVPHGMCSGYFNSSAVAAGVVTLCTIVVDAVAMSGAVWCCRVIKL